MTSDNVFSDWKTFLVAFFEVTHSEYVYSPRTM